MKKRSYVAFLAAVMIVAVVMRSANASPALIIEWCDKGTGYGAFITNFSAKEENMIKYDSYLSYEPINECEYAIISPAYNGVYVYNKNTRKIKKITSKIERLKFVLKELKEKHTNCSGLSALTPELYLSNTQIPRLMLFVSGSCNMACVYCHCSSVVGKQLMSKEIARKAIDEYIKLITSKSPKNKLARVSFMGGGEPMLNMSIIKYAVDYIKERGFSIDINIVTNGITGSIKDWEWLLENNASINISADGPPEIQDSLRPISNSKASSSKILYNRLKWLDDMHAKVHVRTTLLPENIDELDSIINYYKDFSCVKSHQIEPVSPAGRGQHILATRTFYRVFFQKYSSYLYKNPDYYNSSWFRPHNNSEGFCAAIYYNTIVTHDGYVSLCSEVDSKIGRGYFSKYIVSHITNNNPFYSKSAKKFSNEYRSGNRDACKSCPIQYKCGGGCYIKLDRDFNRNWKDFYETYCKISIPLNLSYLIGKYEQYIRQA